MVLGAWCSFSGGDGWLCACVQHFWMGKEALQARDGSQCKSVRHRPRSRAAHRLLPSMLLTVMMAGCVLVCRASGRGRNHCKQEVLKIQLCAVHAPPCKCHSLRWSCCLVLFLQGDDGWLCACVQHHLVWKDAWYSLNQAQAHSQPSSKPHKLR